MKCFESALLSIHRTLGSIDEMKKIVKAILVIVPVVIIWVYFSWFKLPFDTEVSPSGMTKFQSSKFSFEFPGRLMKVEHMPYWDDSEIGTLTNGSYDFFYNYKGTVSGIPSIEELIQYGSSLYTVDYIDIIRDSLEVRYPENTSFFYDSLIQVRKEVIKTITLDKENHQYLFRTAIGADTILVPLLIDSVLLRWLNEYSFSIDTVDGCYRKIFIEKLNPINNAGCYLRNIENGEIHSNFAIKKKDRLIKIGTDMMEREEIESILKSIRLKKSLTKNKRH